MRSPMRADVFPDQRCGLRASGTDGFDKSPSALRALISIVVPAYNAAAHITETIRSIRMQTETRWECVVVDDGSTDDTYDVALRLTDGDSRFTVLRQPNGGASAARNRGFRATRTETTWISFMDSDDIWRPTALSLLLEHADRPATIGAHGLAEMVDATGRHIESGSYPAHGRHRLALQGRVMAPLPPGLPTDFDVLVNGNVLFPPGLILARRSAYEAVGRFDEGLTAAEDWDMLIRLSRVGGLTFVDEVVLDYRRHGKNLGAKPDVPRQAWQVRCLNFWSDENTPAQRRDARKGWRAYQRLLRAQHVRSLRESMAGHHWRGVVGAAAGIAVRTAREARGFPLPRVNRAPLPW